MKQFPLFNIDSSLSPLNDSEVTAEIIEARVSSLSFRNFDFMEKRLPFVLECCTYNKRFWSSLADICENIYFASKEASTILVFPQTTDCGCIRTYRFQPRSDGLLPGELKKKSKVLSNEAKLYELLDTPATRGVFDAWIMHKTEATKLPTELIDGRMRNTSVDKGMIFSRGDGCVVCGDKAQCYAATSIGNTSKAFMVQLPVCKAHLLDAKSHPSVFSFLASLFSLQLDWGDVEKLPYIPDELIPFVHKTASDELSGTVGRAEKTKRGWEIWIELESGWRWLLRLGSFTDFAYMLFEPGVEKERYRSDSAPDHPELKFFPVHEHSAPRRKSDTVAPSFLYGHPFFDLKRFRDVGVKLGAYVHNA